MTIDLHAVVVESAEPRRLSRFWAELLGLDAQNAEAEGSAAVHLEDGLVLRFVPATDAKDGKNRLHLDLASTSEEHQSALADAACALGGRRADIGQGAVPWVVLADPEGNEFCVLEPRDEYRNCGPVAAVVADTINPVSIAEFYSGLTGLPMTRAHPDYASLQRAGGSWLEYVRNPGLPQRQGRLHLQFGAENSPACDHPSTASADPEGNLYCC